MSTNAQLVLQPSRGVGAARVRHLGEPATARHSDTAAFGPTLVTYRSIRPSLSMSPAHAPMPYSRWRMPEAAVTSSKVPFAAVPEQPMARAASDRRSANEPPSTRKMSSHPSSSKSKNRPPDPMISGRNFWSLAPLTCVKSSPARDTATSLNTGSAAATCGCRGEAALRRLRREPRARRGRHTLALAGRAHR